MSKTVPESQIIGERGVITFKDYCNKHTPYLIFREESVHDYGIDGEVEITRIKENGKIEPTAEILKVQIKSTLTGSYIQKETDETFEFHARKSDLVYWNNHSLAVVLVVFNAKTEGLYAKKVNNASVVSTTRKEPIVFNKKQNRLQTSDNQFTEKFSSTFYPRINFDIKERIVSNVFKFSILPDYLYNYNSKIKDAEEVYDVLSKSEFPVFIFKEKKIFTHIDPKQYPEFLELTVTSSEEHIDFNRFKDCLKDRTQKKYCIELLNKEFRDFAASKGIYFNKEYYRYFFGLYPDKHSREVKYQTRSRQNRTRNVVVYKKYIVNEFFRHFGFELDYAFTEQGLFLVINPKYLFTSDRRNPLQDKKKITKYTNYIKQKEHNPQMLNHVHFVFQYLSKNGQDCFISKKGGSRIKLSKYIEIHVPFGILSDTERHRVEDESATQTKLVWPDED